MHLEFHHVFKTPVVIRLEVDEWLTGAFHKVLSKLDHIIKYMATAAQLEQAIADLKAAVAQEKQEIAAKLAAQQVAIDALKAEIATGENPALDKALADVQAITTDIQGIVTPDEPPATPPVA